MAARRFSEAQWREFIQAFEDSSATQEAFVNEHSLPLSSFRAWLYRLRKSKRDVDVGFIELRPQAQVVDEKSTGDKERQVTVEFPNSIRVIFEHQPSMQDLAELVLRLSGHLAC